MAWLAIDKDGAEAIYGRKPIRNIYERWFPDTMRDDYEDCPWINLPKGSIKKLIGRDLTWEDGPVEI